MLREIDGFHISRKVSGKGGRLDSGLLIKGAIVKRNMVNLEGGRLVKGYVDNGTIQWQ